MQIHVHGIMYMDINFIKKKIAHQIKKIHVYTCSENIPLVFCVNFTINSSHTTFEI